MNSDIGECDCAVVAKHDARDGLTGRVAVVTGGGTGIGKATAMLLARLGADVVVASRSAEPLRQAALP